MLREIFYLPCGLYNTSFWNWFLFTYTVMLQEKIMRQLVCMKSCKFVRWATYRLVQDLFHHLYHAPTITHVSNGSAMFSPSYRTGGTPKSDIFDDRGLGHVGRAFLCYSRHPLAPLAKVLWSPTNIPKTSRKVGPITSSKWAEMGSPKKIAYSGLQDFSSLATWATRWFVVWSSVVYHICTPEVEHSSPLKRCRTPKGKVCLTTIHFQMFQGVC